MDSNEPQPGPSSRCSQRLATAEPRSYSCYNDQPPPDDESDEIFEISELVDRRTVLTINSKGEREEDLQYFIRWKGCSESDNTWESIEMFEEFSMVQHFERCLEGEGPCFNPGRRGLEHWQPLPLKWKRKIAQLARQKRQQHQDSSELIDLTSESSDAEVIPLPRDDPEGNSENVEPKEQIPEDMTEKQQEQDANQDDAVDMESDEDDGSTDEGSTSSGEDDSEEVESDDDIQSETDESVHSDNDGNLDDWRIQISPLPPSSPPPPPPPSIEQIITMEADSTEQSFTPPNSPEIRGYIPPLLRRREAASEPCVEEALAADSSTSVTADKTLPVQDPSTHSALPQTSCSGEPSGSERIPDSQPSNITTSPHLAKTIPHPPPAQPQPSSSKNTQDSGEIILVKIKRKGSRPTRLPASRRKTVSKRKQLNLSENVSKKVCTALVPYTSSAVVPYDMGALRPCNSSAFLPKNVTASLEHSSSALVPYNSSAVVPYNRSGVVPYNSSALVPYVSTDTLALPGIYSACSTIDGSTTSTQLTNSGRIVDAEIPPSSSSIAKTDCSDRAATAPTSTDLACTACTPNGMPCNSRTASVCKASNHSTELVPFGSNIYNESAPSSHRSELLNSCSVVNGESILNSTSTELANTSNCNSESTPSSRITELCSSHSVVVIDEIALSSRSSEIDNCTDAEYTTSNCSPALDLSDYISTPATVMDWTRPQSPEFALPNLMYATSNLVTPSIPSHPFVGLALHQHPYSLNSYATHSIPPLSFAQNNMAEHFIQYQSPALSIHSPANIHALALNITHPYLMEPGSIPLIRRDLGNGFRTSGTNTERWTLKRK